MRDILPEANQQDDIELVWNQYTWMNQETNLAPQAENSHRFWQHTD